MDVLVKRPFSCNDLVRHPTETTVNRSVVETPIQPLIFFVGWYFCWRSNIAANQGLPWWFFVDSFAASQQNARNLGGNVSLELPSDKPLSYWQLPFFYRFFELLDSNISGSIKTILRQIKDRRLYVVPRDWIPNFARAQGWQAIHQTLQGQRGRKQYTIHQTLQGHRGRKTKQIFTRAQGRKCGKKDIRGSKKDRQGWKEDLSELGKKKIEMRLKRSQSA